MTKKATGLAAFTEAARPAAPPPTDSSSSPMNDGGRTRGKRERVAIPFRLARRNWERIHQLALAEGISIQQLLFNGLSREFERRGLPPLES